jgi:penicillin-binding protein 1A
VSIEHAGEMNRMLSEAVRTGTGKSAGLSNRPSAGKTGTTQDFKDAWFIGYTRQIVAGVWLGTDEGQPMTKDITGGTLPAVIWKSFMERATSGQPVAALPGINLVDQVQNDASDFDEVLAHVLEGKDTSGSQN